MKKSTRKEDLNLLEEGRDRALTPEGRVHRAALLEAVYEMSKDDVLEGLRIELIDALKQADFNRVNEIRKKVQSYVKTKTFRDKIARKVNKAAGKKEADIIFDKLERG